MTKKKIYNLKEIEKKFKNEWILAEVLEENELNEPIKIRLIAHSKNRDDTYDAMEKTKVKHLTHFYTGPIPRKGYAIMF